MQDAKPMTSPQQPFSPGEPGAGADGCGRPVWIGCALVILLLGVGAMVALWNAPKLFDWAMGKFEAEVTAALPEDVTADQRERLGAAFAATREAVADGSADALALQELQQRLTARIMSSGEKLTAGDVEELIEALEAVAGGAVPVEETPVPESPGP